MNANEMIKFSKVSLTYSNQNRALNEISFVIGEREVVFLTGHSGAGKTTLLNLITLDERPSAGFIRIKGLPAQWGAREIPKHRRRLGIVFQDHRLLHNYNVLDNVALPLLIAGRARRAAREKALSVLEELSLKRYAGQKPQQLSTGEQQRVGIARAIVNSPQLIIADEPTGNLDPELSKKIMKLFVDINRQHGATVIIATHDLDTISKMKGRRLALKEGHLIAEGPNNSGR